MNKMNNKKSKIACLLIIFVLLLSSSSFINNSNSFTNTNLSTIQEEDISVEWGDNVYQNLPYWYSGTFYDDADFDFAWTTAKIDFEYIPDNSITYSHLITDLDNSETQYPTNSSFTMVNGTHVQNGTLDVVDGDYHAFDSTYNKTIAEQPFTIINGSSTYDGDLEIIDGNYTTFVSGMEKHYLGTYSFTNNTNGMVPDGWDDVSGAGCSATVNQGIFGHEKVLELNDTSSNVVMIGNTFTEQTSGTIEWWWLDTSSSYAFMYIIGDGDVVIYLSTISNSYHYDLGGWQNVRGRSQNVWYRHRIDFECGAGGYMGLPADTYDWYIDDVLEANNIPFRASFHPDDIDVFRTTSSGASLNYKYYLDAVGYSWDPDYNIGDNQDIEPLDLDIEVNINLDSFSNLNELYLVYAYLTNISLTCNYSIYNFDDSVYDVIENDINLAFVNSYFELNSSYYNNTNDLILSFQMSINAEFEMRLDRLLIRKPSYLNFSTSVNFDILTDLLQMDINSYQRSNITQLINMSIWSYNTSSWVYLDGASYITTFQLLEWISTDFSNYINTNGDVLLSYYGVNIMDAFRFELDALSFKIWRKTIVQFEKTLRLLGTWKYQFTLDAGLGTEHVQDWIYFNVILEQPNFEGISESRYSTEWILTSTATTGEKNIVYNDDLTTGYWDLCDISTRFFNKFAPNHLDYLLDNSTSTSTISYLGTHFDTGTEDGYPIGITWDGTHFWVIGDTNDEVYKYTSAGVYTGTHFDTGAQDVYPRGITWDGAYFWMLGTEYHEVYKYTSAGVYTGTHFDANVPDGIPAGITWDGTHFWIGGIITAEYYQYTSAGVYTGTHFDVGAQDTNMFGTTWDGTHFWILGRNSDEVYKYTSAGVYTGTHFDANVPDGIPAGITWDGTHFWIGGIITAEYYQYTSAGVYTGTHFDVGAQDTNMFGTTWDGTHFWILGRNSDEVYKYTSAGVYTGTHFDVGAQDTGSYGITWDGAYFWMVGSNSDEAYRYSPEYIIYKNYHDTTGEGYVYFQSDQVETLGLISPQYSSISLSKGDIFTVDIQTTSDNALLKLYSGSDLQLTLNLLTANTEFSRQEVEVLVSEDVSFDRIKITSELTDVEYFKLYDIKAEHWVFEDEADQRSMYVNPYGQNDLIANLGNNSLKIYENDILRTDIYITISYDLLTYIFESTIPETIFVSFYDSNNNYLDFNKFSTYVNYTLYEENYIDQRLTSREFYVDEDSTIYFNVYDSFEVSIYSTSRLAKTFIDITLNVYFFKIKNEALEDASYTLTKGSVSKEGILFPEDIDEYQIASGNYSFNYINYEDDSEHSLNINLIENQLLTINTTFYNVHFSVFNFDGLGLNKDLFRFYINGLRKDFGFNILKRDINNLKVLDYFNATLFNQNLSLKQYTEYNIYVQVYTLIVNNNYTHSIYLEIERNDITIKQIVPTQSGISYRFLPNITYELRTYQINGTLLENRTVLLDSNNKIVSFGFYSEEIPEIPDFDLDDTWLLIIFILTIFGVIIVFIIFIAVRLNKDNKSNKSKLNKYISKGRDTEAEYYGRNPNPF